MRGVAVSLQLRFRSCKMREIQGGRVMSFADVTAWVTGASSGIGEALAKGLAARGAHVVLSGRRRDALAGGGAGVAEAIGASRAKILPFEATDYDALPGVVEEAFAWRGRIDLLVNNAGVSQ